MTARPTGTVTFLFTDIEGSTRMWERDRAAMREALERHDSLLRSAIDAAGGYVFSTAGDAFSAAFSDPGAAFAASVEMQRTIGAEDWGKVGPLNVRVALHTGVAHERDGDYFGPALNRVARILSAGHGGQILLSLGTEELLGGTTEEFAFEDLGEHTLKDLGRPERIFQATGPGLRTGFPPLNSIDSYLNNLPIQLTSFVGRELELIDVVKRLHDHRLLTLTGVGGSGKTRLAIQAAAESIDDYPDGVWLVELASIGDSATIPGAIGETLGLTRSQGGAGNSQLGADPASVLDQLTAHLQSRASLLVLDNCEHLITATARLVQHLLQHCPDLTVLATSREGLGVPGESLWQVPSLASFAGEDPMSSEAVRLFVERAQDANARFGTDPETLRWVLRICERLDGMPLAIELAASRARVLDARQIAERLDDRFRLLTGGSRTALPRHQTLEATVDWSYDLMSDPERILFQRLAAFRGGFTLEAAETVCQGGGVDAYDILDHLGSLVDKSMVVRDEVTGRFRMLETLRQYALRRLTESDEIDAVRLAHADYFAAFIAENAPQLNAAGEAEAYEAITRDHDNLRAAMAYCLENGHTDKAVGMVAAMSWYWWAASDTNEGLEWLRKALPSIDAVDTRTASAALAFAGLFAGFRKDPDADSLAQAALERAAEDDHAAALAHMASAFIDFVGSRYDESRVHMLDMLVSGERAGDPWLIGQAQLLVSYLDRMVSRLDEAGARLAAAEAIFRTQGSRSGLAWCLVVAGQIARYRFDFATEIRKQQEARTIFAEVGAETQIALTLVNESLSLVLLGRAPEAVALTRRALAIHREHALNDEIIEVLVLGAWFEYEAGNVQEALDLYRESLERSAPGLDPANLQLACQHLGLLVADLGRHEDAARLLGFYEANQNRPEAEIYAQHFAPLREATASALGSRYDALLGEGASLTARQLYDYALGVIAEVSEGR